MAYYLLVRYYSNKGYILDNPHYYSSGITSYSSVTASSSSSYKYFKTDSTRTNQTSTVIKGATSSGGTYGSVGNRYTASSTSTVCNLTDVSTFGLTRDGYHIDADQAYKSSDGTKVYGQNGSSAPSANRATISRLGGSTSANKTVSIYVNWIGNSYTVRFNPSGGSGSMSDQTGFVFGTETALNSNTFTRTGYTFAGWSKSSGSATRVFYVSDVGPYDPISIGTDGTYLYFKQTSTQYYRVTVDNSNSYTDVGSTAPSGVSTWIGEGTHFTFQGNEYYWSHTYNDNTGIDKCYIYQVASAQTVDYANQASMSDAGGQTPVEAGTTVVNLYAVWTPNTYTIDYMANGGSFPGTTPTTSATYNSNVTFSSTTPTRTGYTFLGWSSSSTATSATWTAGQTTTTPPNLTSVNGGVVRVYAVWQARIYGVGFNDNQADEGSTGLTSCSVTYGSTMNNSVAIPTRVGYTFDGYYTALTGGTQVYNSSGNAVAGTYWNSPANIRVFYIWDEGPCIPNAIGTDGTYVYLRHYYGPQYYRVTVDDTNSYTLLSSEPSGVTWVTSQGSANTISYQGNSYYYSHTYNDNTGRDSAYIYRINTAGSSWQYNGDLPLYAQWTAKSYTYTLNPNGGIYNNTTGTTSKSVISGSTTNNSPGVPTRTGYIFDGWYTEATGGFKVFDSSGNAIGNYSNGYWYNASPTTPLSSGAYYIHYGMCVWGFYADSNGGTLYVWDDAAEMWTSKVTKSSYTTMSNIAGIGNLIGTNYNVIQGVMVAIELGSCCNREQTYTLSTVTQLGPRTVYGVSPNIMGSTTLPTDGVIWIGNTNPTFYAHWIPTIYVKQSGSWIDSVPQIKVNDTWKTPNHVYIKANDTWKQIY